MKTTSSAVVKRRDLSGERAGGSAWRYHQNGFDQQEVSHRVALKRRRRPDSPDGYARPNSAFTHPYALFAGQKRMTFQRTRLEADRRHRPCASYT